MSTILIAMAVAGVAMFIVFFAFLIGGVSRMKATRAVDKRGFIPDVPVSADGVISFLVPQGFALQTTRPPLTDWRDEFRVTWRASLGAYSGKFGSGSAAELRITAAVAAGPEAAQPYYQDWRLEGERDGLLWYVGRPPAHTSSIGAWSSNGVAVTLWSEHAYDREQSRVIVAGVLRSIELQTAWQSACKIIRDNTGQGAINRDAFRKIIAGKLAPLPDADGVVAEVPGGRGFVMRDGAGSPRLIVVLGAIALASGEDPLSKIRSFQIDAGRVSREFASGWGEIDGAPEAGILALWTSVDGSAKLHDVQRQVPVPRAGSVEDLPELPALRRAAQPGKIVFLRHWLEGSYRTHPAWQLEQWISASLVIADWARDGAPLWIPSRRPAS